jgi:hypothetical protein
LIHTEHKVCSHIVTEYEKAREERSTRTITLEAKANSKGISHATSKEPEIESKPTQKLKIESKPKSKPKTEPKLSTKVLSTGHQLEKDDGTMSDEKDALNQAIAAVCQDSSLKTGKDWARVVAREVKHSVCLPNKNRVRVLLHAWFITLTRSVDDILVDALQTILGDSPMVRRYMEFFVIASLEEIFSAIARSHAAIFVRWLHDLWEEDIVQEETLTAWAGGTSEALLVSEGIRLRLVKASRPFLLWLAKAESDDESVSNF